MILRRVLLLHFKGKTLILKMVYSDTKEGSSLKFLGENLEPKEGSSLTLQGENLDPKEGSPLTLLGENLNTKVSSF